MKRIFTGLMLMIFAGAGSMVAQDGHYHRDRGVRRDYAGKIGAPISTMSGMMGPEINP